LTGRLALGSIKRRAWEKELMYQPQKAAGVMGASGSGKQDGTRGGQRVARSVHVHVLDYAAACTCNTQRASQWQATHA
jgi:hypothetical protein